MIGAIAAHYADAAPASGWNAAVAALSPWAWYKFDEVSGVAQDSSGNGRHCTASAFGNPTYQQASLIPSDASGKSYTFSGAVGPRTPGAPSNQTAGLTIAFTYKGAGAAAGSGFVLSSGLIGIGAASNWIIKDWSTTWDTGVSASSIKDGAAHLIVITWKHLDARIYVDGVQVAASTSARLLNDAAPIEIGRSGGTNNFNGGYDEWAYFASALTAGQVSSLHSAWL